MKATLLAVAALVVGCVIGFALTQREFAHEVLPIDVNPVVGDGSGRAAPAEKIGPKAVVDNSERYDFGTMDRNEHGTHAFVVRNDGDAPLTVTTGKTTCKCTVFATAQDKVLPGKTADVKLEWDVKTGDEEFEQSAELHTNDPRRETIHLSVHGHVIDTVRAERSDVHFHDLSVNETASDSVNIYAFRDAAFRIEKIDFGDANLAAYFNASHRPLSAEEVAQQPGAKAGEKLLIDIKPGLPVGPFIQTAIVTTNQSSPVAVNVQLIGEVVSDILLAGSKINKNTWSVFLGTVPRQEGVKHTVYLRIKGPHRDETQFRITQTEPATEFSATLGDSSHEIPKVVTYPLTIEIPPGARPVARTEEGYAKIHIATTHPDVKELILKVRYTVKE
jgi:uncharacterized protein DUF1573